MVVQLINFHGLAQQDHTEEREIPIERAM